MIELLWGWVNAYKAVRTMPTMEYATNMLPIVSIVDFFFYILTHWESVSSLILLLECLSLFLSLL